MFPERQPTVCARLGGSLLLRSQHQHGVDRRMLSVSIQMPGVTAIVVLLSC